MFVSSSVVHFHVKCHEVYQLILEYTYIYMQVFKWKIGIDLLWMFFLHTQHNCCYPSMYKKYPLCSIPLYMFIFYQKADRLKFEYNPPIKCTFYLWKGQRHSCSFTVMSVNSQKMGFFHH